MGASDKKVKPKSSGRQTVKGVNFARQDEKKIKHIKMLANGHKAVRDRNGKIVEAAEFQSREAKPGMIQPDRRWFGNTRVISQDALTHFRDSLASRQADPYSVVLKQNKLPMSLLQESTTLSRPNLTTAEPFGDTFGPKAQRKRPRIEVGTFEELAAKGLAKPRKGPLLGETGLEELEVQDPAPADDEINDDDLGQDEPSAQQKAEMDEAAANNAPLDYILQAGTSRRIWGELYKVIDSSDIILHVLDARDPIGTRCHSVENYLAKEKRSKKVIYILNKVDLIPGWAAVSPPFLSSACSLLYLHPLLQIYSMHSQVRQQRPLSAFAFLARVERLDASGLPSTSIDEEPLFSCRQDRYVHGRSHSREAL